MMIDADTLVGALADPTRLRTAVLLRAEGPLCVCELTAALDVSQPKMSRHLAALRAVEVVADARVANRVFYRLHRRLPGWAVAVIDHLAAGLASPGDVAALRQRLHALPNRPLERAATQAGDGGRERVETDHAV